MVKRLHHGRHENVVRGRMGKPPMEACPSGEGNSWKDRLEAVRLAADHGHFRRERLAGYFL
jgi:hypothetical protein